MQIDTALFTQFNPVTDAETWNDLHFKINALLGEVLRPAPGHEASEAMMALTEEVVGQIEMLAQRILDNNKG